MSKYGSVWAGRMVCVQDFLCISGFQIQNQSVGINHKLVLHFESGPLKPVLSVMENEPVPGSATSISIKYLSLLVKYSVARVNSTGPSTEPCGVLDFLFSIKSQSNHSRRFGSRVSFHDDRNYTVCGHVFCNKSLGQQCMEI